MTFTLLLPAGLMTRAAAAEPIEGADFLRKLEVKQLLHGSGRWYAQFHQQPNARGAIPARCAPDRALRRNAENLRKVYFGKRKGQPAASLRVYRYDRKKAARKDMRRLARFPRKCSQVTEFLPATEFFVEVKRTKVSIRRIGEQRTAWRVRETRPAQGGQLQTPGYVSRGYVVAVRRGRTIVVVRAEARGHQRPAKPDVVWLAKSGLKRAT